MRYFLIPCIFFVLITTAHAGELYICTDKSGRVAITSLPQDGMKCVLKETFGDPSPEERAERENKEKETAEEAENNSAQEKAKENLQKCFERANQQYRQSWDGRCRTLNRNFSCFLPAEITKQLEDQFEEEKERCLKLYP